MLRIGRRAFRAGRHADAWFARTYGAWRREVRWRILLVLPVVAAPPLSVSLLVPDHRQFFVGLAVGSAMACYLWAIDSPPEWIERKRRGRDGERSTEKELTPLERRGWAVGHDLPAKFGNYDHLVVGPAGAYLLETKRFVGEATLRDGVLGLRRGTDPRDAWRGDKELAGRLRGSARDARRLLGAANINWVAPVVVLWCDFPPQVAEHGGVTYVHGPQLAAWLESQPITVSAQSVENARSCLRRLEADALRDAA
jgi:hypothetical protein